MLTQYMPYWTRLVLLGHLFFLGSWPVAGCQLTIDLSAGAPAWFGSNSITTDKLNSAFYRRS